MTVSSKDFTGIASFIVQNHVLACRLLTIGLCIIAGNHTISVIKTSEDYNSLSTGLSNVRQAVNELIEAGFTLVNGKKVALQFYLGGDYKVSKMKIHVDYQNCICIHLTIELVLETI